MINDGDHLFSEGNKIGVISKNLLSSSTSLAIKEMYIT